MRHILSYAWFNSPNTARPRYFFNDRIPMVLRAARALFPEWEIRIHYDPATLDTEPYGAVLKRLADGQYVTLVDCGPATRGAEAMLWRLKPVWEVSSEYVLSRDLDSVASPRERWAVEAFIASRKAMHLLNDSPSHHRRDLPFMLGGMVGFWAPAFRTRTEIREWGELIRLSDAAKANLGGYGGDQDAMMKVFHPRLYGDYLHHPHGPDGKALIQPCALSADIDLRAMAQSWTEYIGMVVSNLETGIKWFDKLPTSAPIAKAERECGL